MGKLSEITWPFAHAINKIIVQPFGNVYKVPDIVLQSGGKMCVHFLNAIGLQV